jgi:hypothetical protein
LSSCRLSSHARPKIEEGVKRKEWRVGISREHSGIAEIEGAKGEGVAGAAFSAGARDEGGVGVWTIFLSERSGASISPSQFQ